MTIEPVLHRPPLPGKVVVHHLWIVNLISLITPKRIYLIIWDWSHFKNILEENMVNIQNEGPPRFLGGGVGPMKNWFNGHETWQISIHFYL